MVELLAQERAAGTPFDEAWPRCLRLCMFRLPLQYPERRDWREALVATRESWQRAYEGHRPARAEVAVVRALTDALAA